MVDREDQNELFGAFLELTNESRARLALSLFKQMEWDEEFFPILKVHVIGTRDEQKNKKVCLTYEMENID
jgi:hypothetical protein